MGKQRIEDKRNEKVKFVADHSGSNSTQERMDFKSCPLFSEYTRGKTPCVPPLNEKDNK